MPTLSQAEKTYDSGKTKENQTDHQAAAELYQTQPKDLICQLAYVRLITEKKVSPFSGRECSDNERDEQIDNLLSTIIKEILEKTDFKKKHVTHKEITNLIKVIKNWNPAKSEHQAKKHFFLAKLEIKKLEGRNNKESLKNLIEAAKLKNNSAIIEVLELSKTLSRFETIQVLVVESMQVLTDPAKLSEPHLIILTINFLEAVMRSKITKDELLKSQQGTQALTQDESVIIDTFDLANIENTIISLYKKSLIHFYSLEQLIKSIQQLSKANALDDDNVTQCDNFLGNLDSDPSNQTEIAIAYCLLGKYFKDKNPKKASAYFKKWFNKLTPIHSHYQEFYSIYQEVLQKTNENSDLLELQETKKRFDGGQGNYNEATQLEQQGRPYLAQAIALYKKAALHGHQASIEKLFSFTDNPEALLAQSEILNNFDNEKINEIGRKKLKLANNKKKETLANELQNTAKDKYEEELKKDDGKRRQDIFRVIANLRYHGTLFEKNLVLARELYKKAVADGDTLAYYPYANMCLNGEGGPVDIATVKSIIEKLPNETASADELYLKSEVYYLSYLQALDTKSNDPEIELERCIATLLAACIKGNKNALLSLFILHHYDKEIKATLALAELYQHTYEQLPLLQGSEFPNFPQDKNQYYLEFYDQLYSTTNDPILLNNIEALPAYRQEKARINAAKNDVAAKFHQAKSQLENDHNPLPLRKIKEPEFRPEIIELLTNYYKQIENGALKLLTTLCYEIQRHQWNDENCKNDPEYQIMYRVLCHVDERFEHYDIEGLKDYLKTQEQKQKTYFDEYASDESDPETEDVYQGQDKHVTADYTAAKELTKDIESAALKKLQALAKAKSIDDEQYKKEVDAIKNLFNEAIKMSMGTVSREAQVEEDLRTINHFSALGKLQEGLRIVSTKFLVAQTRGIHFKTTLWNQPQRREYRRLIKDKDHPLHNTPIYSAAVYDRAGVKDFTDLSPITQLRLEKIARHIALSLSSFAEKEAYTSSDDAKLPSNIFKYNFKSRREQTQHLYSNEYDLFHEFLAHENQRPNPMFFSRQNPIVSTADIQSSHSGRYAYGNKPYAGHEHERLRPKYTREGRALRPHAGVMFLTLHPLDDFTGNNHNHVVSMNMRVDVVIDKLIIHERECAFYSFIKNGRLTFLHRAKYPSFHHPNYLQTFLYNYGLTPALYAEFKNLLSATAPHENKRRLTILLLGEYLSAYQTLFLLRFAHIKANKQNQILLYRDKYGNFSLKPTYDITPSPNGDDDSLRLRRYDTHVRKQEFTKGGAAVPATPSNVATSSTTSAPSSAATSSHRTSITPRTQPLSSSSNTTTRDISSYRTGVALFQSPSTPSSSRKPHDVDDDDDVDDKVPKPVDEDLYLGDNEDNNDSFYSDASSALTKKPSNVGSRKSKNIDDDSDNERDNENDNDDDDDSETSTHQQKRPRSGGSED
jgi:TPR repeat protein